MNRRQKLVQQRFLNNEAGVIRRLDQVYGQALKDIDAKIEKLMKRFDPETGDLPQSAIYQIKYQKMLKSQIEGILNQMQTKQYLTVSDYLDECYEDGFIGALFDLHGQDVPLMMPINQEAMVSAVQLESKISQGLYTRLGEDVDLLKKRITAEVSRSIATGTSYAQTAKQLAGKTRIGYNNAIRIARTEGHRIQNTAIMNAAEDAKDRGADLVKQWDATLDGKTRESHVAVDGQIRELNESFGNGLDFPGDPAGSAAEVVNCRCALLQRARWTVGGSFTKWNNFTKQLETFDSPEAYDEFKKAFFSDENKRYMNYVQQMEQKYKTRDFEKILDRMTPREYAQYEKLLAANPVFNKKTKPIFIPAETLEEAEAYAARFVIPSTWSGNGIISYKGMSLECANVLNQTLTELFDAYDIPQLRNIQPMNFRQSMWKGAETAPMAYRDMQEGELFFNPKIFKSTKAFDKYFEDGAKAYDFCIQNIDRFSGAKREMVERYARAGRSLVADDAMDHLKATIQHEVGHHIQHKRIGRDKAAAQIVNDGFMTYNIGVSGYACNSKGEYIAESFCAYMNGEADRIDPALKTYFERLKR